MMSQLFAKLGYKLYVNTPLGPYYFKQELKKAEDKFESGTHSSLKVVNCFPYEIVAIPYSLSNYGYIVYQKYHAGCLLIDPGYPPPFITFISENKLIPKMILISHKHHDHSFGVKEFLTKYPDIEVVGSKADNIKHATRLISKENEKITFRCSMSDPESIESITIGALLTPGHTLGHVIYSLSVNHQIDNAYNSGDASCALYFTGDTIFMGSIGKMFEGTPGVYFNSIRLFIESLLEHNCSIDNIFVFPGHEYGVENLSFINQILYKTNKYAAEKLEFCKLKRENREPTIPCLIPEEVLFNPFIQIVLAENKELQKALNDKFGVHYDYMNIDELWNIFSLDKTEDSSENFRNKSSIELFKEVRKMRNTFRFIH